MQLNKKVKLSVAEKLALAATALMSGATGAADTEDVATESKDNEWSFVGSVLAYNETDRVQAVELLFSADKQYGDAGNLSLKVVLDALTGASASGAIPQPTVQTFTRPSGNGQYTIAAYDTPLDDTFRDGRGQFNVSWTDAIDQDSRYTVGSNLSKEFDYLSLSFNGEYARDFNKRNTTLSAGISFAFDTVTPKGGMPIPLATMVVDQGQFATRDDFLTAFNATRSATEENIDTTELLLGWTQVVNRQMIMQFNYSYSDVNGYLTDPFKVLSVIDNNAQTQSIVYENRPDSKKQHAFFALGKYHLDESVTSLSYRYVTNDWELDSHTIDFKWHFYGDNNTFWEPHIRFYQQTAAEFYNTYLQDGQPLPEFASADYRLGDMDAITLGIKYGFELSGGNRAEIRAEYYNQTPKANGPELVAATKGLDLYPELDAVFLQFTYFF
ncbi:MAG: DUF3570 domain-containing protein [Gammaproteobacteria bacterium]|nr:DUF3570 domain-containing protein [Gammaproteobacteria bacterium]MDH5629929.1 DUF3570 domain-containing protein [Gammaproteobacteria bacterium]